MKLNKKGYMLVEIIVAFTLAFSIAIYLLNLTLNFKDKNEEIYYSTRYLKDKNLIIKNIMEDLERGSINSVVCMTDKVTFKLTFADRTQEDRMILLNNKVIEYGKTDSGGFVTTDKSYYKKELESSLIIGSISTSNCIYNITEGYFKLTIPISSMYSDDNYDIKIFSSNIII